jgi:hypothetical protein
MTSGYKERPMLEQISGAPPAIVAALDRVKEELLRVADKNLAGLILYGGLARGRYRPGQSDVNVVLLLHEASAPALAAVAPVLRAAWRAAGVVPMILTRAEVPQTVELFPTKFLDIARHHVVLYGEDAFAGLEVSRPHILLHVRQGLRNLLLHLRRRYVAAGSDPEVLTRVLAGSARSLAIELATLLYLAGKPVPSDDHSADVFAAAARAFGLAPQPLARLAALRQNPRQPADLPALYAAVLDAVARAADTADRLKEAP